MWLPSDSSKSFAPNARSRMLEYCNDRKATHRSGPAAGRLDSQGYELVIFAFCGIELALYSPHSQRRGIQTGMQRIQRIQRIQDTTTRCVSASNLRKEPEAKQLLASFFGNSFGRFFPIRMLNPHSVLGKMAST